MSRTETPELRDLADKYQGALVIYLGDVAKDEDNKVQRKHKTSSTQTADVGNAPVYSKRSK
jgi:hypothetical protein